MKNRKNKKGFTIVELVIVIGVIGILSAILIPTFVNLTSKAQENANKQQIADGYTAYVVEANDYVYDNLYVKEDEAYIPANVAIAYKTQSEVAMKLGNEWYQYVADKGWEVYTPASEPTTLVVAKSPELTGAYTKDGNNYVALDSSKTTNKALSTFNGAVIYIK